MDPSDFFYTTGYQNGLCPTYPVGFSDEHLPEQATETKVPIVTNTPSEPLCQSTD